MENSFKNSLLGQLAEFGFNTDNKDNISNEPNPLAISVNEADIKNSPFMNLDNKNPAAQNPINPMNSGETYDNTGGSETYNAPSPEFPQSSKLQNNDEAPKRIIQKRLNDFDFNILQDSAFVNIEDSELSDDEKISKVTNLIKEIDRKLFLIKERDNSKLKEKLLSDKEMLLGVLSRLNSNKNQGLAAINTELKEAINGSTFALLRSIRQILPNDRDFDGYVYKALHKFMHKYFPKLYKGFLVKQALNKLMALNQTAGELLTKRIPYGESSQRYDALIEYLSSANTIHAKLLKKM